VQHEGCEQAKFSHRVWWVKAFAVALPVLTDVLNREGIGTSEVFAALDAGMMFVEVCQESISNQAGMGNKDRRRWWSALSHRHCLAELQRPSNVYTLGDCAPNKSPRRTLLLTFCFRNLTRGLKLLHLAQVLCDSSLHTPAVSTPLKTSDSADNKPEHPGNACCNEQISDSFNQVTSPPDRSRKQSWHHCEPAVRALSIGTTSIERSPYNYFPDLSTCWIVIVVFWSRLLSLLFIL